MQGRFSKALFNISKGSAEGLGNFSAVPCCLAPVCILPGEILEPGLGVEQQRLSPGSWGIHDGEVEAVTSWCQL